MVMDNLGAHKVQGVRERIEAAGARLLDLSPYRADFNPIELAWSKLKNHRRKGGCAHYRNTRPRHRRSLARSQRIGRGWLLRSLRLLLRLNQSGCALKQEQAPSVYAAQAFRDGK